MSELHSFLRLNYIPLCIYTTFLFIHSSILVVSTFWLLWVMLLWRRCANTCLSPVLDAFECILRSEIAESQGNSVFNYWRSCHTVFWSNTNILHSQQGCTGVPFLYILAITFFHFLIIAFLTAGKVKQYLTVGLVCISLTASDVEHLLMHHLGLRIQTNMKILGQTQQKSQYKGLPWWSSG